MGPMSILKGRFKPESSTPAGMEGWKSGRVEYRINGLVDQWLSGEGGREAGGKMFGLTGVDRGWLELTGDWGAQGVGGKQSRFTGIR